MKKALIIGYGEVGQALHALFSSEPLILDSSNPKFKDSNKIKGVYFLHICYTYSERFLEHTKEYLDRFEPYSTIIHSTVPVGTTQKLNSYLLQQKRKVSVFHSPVRGQHPKLAKSLLTFVKYL